MSSSEVKKRLGAPSFQSTQQGTLIWEYWARSEHPHLAVWFENDRIVRLDGGLPEIDGDNALNFAPTTLQRRLGPAQNSGSGGEVSGQSHRFFTYPNHRLLIQHSAGINRFILFKAR